MNTIDSPNSFSFLTPAEQLFELLTSLKPICAPRESNSTLVWPDGRVLELPSIRAIFQEEIRGPQGVIPVDGSLCSFTERLAFRLEFLDENPVAGNAQAEIDLPHLKGREGYVVANTHLHISLYPDWAKDGNIYAGVSIVAAGKKSREVFAKPFVQRRLAEVAHESGVLSLSYPGHSGNAYTGHVYLYQRATEEADARDRLETTTIIEDLDQWIINYRESGRELSPEDAEKLADCTHHSLRGIRGLACGYIGITPERFAAPLLIERLQDTDWQIRASAAGALSALMVPQESDMVWEKEQREVGHPPFPMEKAVSALVATLQDAHREVRIAALNALHEMRAAGVVPPVLDLMQACRWEQPDLGVIKAALHCLSALSKNEIEHEAVLRRLENLQGAAGFPLTRDASGALQMISNIA